MVVKGSVDPTPLAGRVHRRHVIEEGVTGPSAGVSVAAGGTGTLDFSIAAESPRDVEEAGVGSITGLPTDVYVSSISVDKAGKKVNITVYNAGAAGVTVTAGSVTVRVVSLS